MNGKHGKHLILQVIEKLKTVMLFNLYLLSGEETKHSCPVKLYDYTLLVAV